MRHTQGVVWAVEATDQFAEWSAALDAADIDSVNYSVDLLESVGPELGRPHADAKQSVFKNMKELRVQAAGRPIRIFFAFDPNRTAILLIGGAKAGNSRFYERMIRVADRLYADHLAELENRGT
jgi:hypothetical protein